MRTRRLRPLFHRLLAAVGAPGIVCAASSAAAVGACSSTEGSIFIPNEADVGEVDMGLPPCPQDIQTLLLPTTCSSDAGDDAASDAATDGPSGDAAADASVDGGGVCACEAICAQRMTVTSCRVLTSDAGAAQIECKGIPFCLGGRRPDGLEPCDVQVGPPSVVFLLRAAHLEAASVDAFEILARELAAHGAPTRLASAARRAADDEVRHARAMARIAGAAAPPKVSVTRSSARRTLEAMALENAREGCIRETFAALLAERQARTATNPRVRAAMAGIARDEARHAALSWRVAAWIEPRLSPRARKRVERERRRAARALRRDLSRGGAEQPALGLPAALEATALLDALVAELVEPKLGHTLA